MKNPAKTYAYINPAILAWARIEMNYDLETAAEKIGVKLEKLKGWEKGIGHPTFTQLRKLALDVYKRPSATFFRQTIPNEQPLNVEFRTLTSARIKALSSNMRLAIRKAKQLQRFNHEILEVAPPPFQIADFSLNIQQSVVASAAEFRSFLGLDIEEQFAWKSHYQAFESLRTKIEECGAGVFLLDFPLPEARGFALYNSAYPVIIINEHDVIQGRIFTLIHETCHILLKMSSIFDDVRVHGIQRDFIRLEKFCNAFAGEFLIPTVLFRTEIQKFQQNKDAWTDRDFVHLANRFKTSREVVLRRLMDFDLVTDKFYGYKKKTWEEENTDRKDKERQKQIESNKPVLGQPAHKKAITEKGKNFIGKVLNLLSEDQIGYWDVYKYLDIKAEQFPKMLDSLQKRK